MNIYIGKQPIFDIEEKIYGYELLFRSSESNVYNGTNAVISTNKVLTAAFSSFNITELVHNKRAFVNFPKELILNYTPKIFPTAILIIEILEDTEPTDELITALAELKDIGYTIALDDFVYEKNLDNLVLIADIIKIDFCQTKGTERSSIIKDLLKINPSLKFLAEKVETKEEFEEAKNYGYSYFQGYFFAKPVVISKDILPGNKSVYLRLLKEVTNKPLTFEKTKEILRSDVSLIYKFLKYINSAYFPFNNKVKTIEQACVLLGLQKIKIWLMTTLIGHVAQNIPDELTLISLIRAKFCELLGKHKKNNNFPLDYYFLTGLFSIIDVTLRRPKEEIFQEIYLFSEIKDALLGKENELYYALYTAVAYEKMRDNEEEIKYFLEKLGIERGTAAHLYLETLNWLNEVLD